MELTQIKGEGAGKKISMSEALNKIQSSSQILNGTPASAHIESNENKNILKPLNAPITVNSKEVKKQATLKAGDSITLGEKKEDVFAVHKKGEDLEKHQVVKHLEKAGHEISNTEITKIMKKLEKEEKMIRDGFIVMLVLALFFGGAMTYIGMGNSDLKSKINYIGKENFLLEEKLASLRERLGENEECLDGECDEEETSISQAIANLEEENKKIQERVENINTSEIQNTITILEEKLSSVSATGSLATKTEVEEIKNTITLMIQEAVVSVAKTAEEFKEKDSEGSKALELRINEIEEMFAVENVDFGENGEKTSQAIRILLGKIQQLQGQIEELKQSKTETTATPVTETPESSTSETTDSEGETMSGSTSLDEGTVISEELLEITEEE